MSNLYTSGSTANGYGARSYDGITWKYISSQLMSRVRNVFTADDTNLYASNDADGLQHSYDGGDNWTRWAGPVLGTSNIVSWVWVDGTTAYLAVTVAGSLSLSGIYTCTLDAGVPNNTWVLLSGWDKATQGIPREVVVVGGNIIAISSGGTPPNAAAGLVVSTDAGSTFAQEESETTLKHLFVDGTTCYVCSPTQGYLKGTTADNFADWTINSNAGSNCHSIWADGDTIYVGTHQDVQKSTDGGTTFSLIETPDYDGGSDPVEFPTRGIARYETLDGTKTYIQVESDSTILSSEDDLEWVVETTAESGARLFLTQVPAAAPSPGTIDDDTSITENTTWTEAAFTINAEVTVSGNKTLTISNLPAWSDITWGANGAITIEAGSSIVVLGSTEAVGASKRVRYVEV